MAYIAFEACTTRAPFAKLYEQYQRGNMNEQAPFRLVELLGALSLATDLANGNPPETALRTCLLAVNLAQEAGVTGSELSEVYYTSLLRFLGCTASAHEEGAIHGDNIAARQFFAPFDLEQHVKVLSAALTGLGKDLPTSQRLRSVASVFTKGHELHRNMAAANCEVAVRLAKRLGMTDRVCLALSFMHERWDGEGVPGKASGESIPRAARITHLANTAEIYTRIGGPQEAREVIARRSKGQLDPKLVEVFLRSSREILAKIDKSSVWDDVLALEPASAVLMPLDDIIAAFADFADIGSVFTLGHSAGVARLASAAGAAAGLDEQEQRLLYRAGLLHDLGNVSVPAGTWEKHGKLTASEWERVQLHPYHTERVLRRAPILAPLATMCGAHHERLDGSGYHRNTSSGQLPFSARILAVADFYHALTEARPHRPAFSPQEAGKLLQEEASTGRLDLSATKVVLAASGQRPAKIRRDWPAGLSDREVEVLRWVTQGHTNKAIAKELSISARTVQHHLIHAYEKIGVSTRAAAALFIAENDLLHS